MLAFRMALLVVDKIKAFTHKGKNFKRVSAVFKIEAASLEARGAFKIVICFLHHGNSKVCLLVHFRFI